jgi:hypothetical protein
MAYDKGLAQRVRELLAEEQGFAEKKMFGGVCFLLHGNMACGIINDDLIVRVGLPDYETSLALPHTRRFDITGRTLKGWVMVEADGHEEDEHLSAWVRKGVRFTLTLPPK